MPIDLAVAATFFGPRSRSSCAYTVLSEWSVAWAMLNSADSPLYAPAREQAKCNHAFTAARLALQERGSALVSETLNSNTVNLVFGVSIPALFIAIGSTSALTGFSLGWLLLITFVVLALLARTRGVGRSAGAAILLLYAVFVVVKIVGGST